jgi:hypothetical protein
MATSPPATARTAKIISYEVFRVPPGRQRARRGRAMADLEQPEAPEQLGG